MADPHRVLCVDDDEALVELTATRLERVGDFDAVTETSADDALARLRGGDGSSGGRARDHRETNEATPPAVDAVVSDYQMPGMDGLELLEAVRESHPELPFILFTGRGSEAVASDAIAAGVTDYLQKSTGTEQYELLANRLENAIEQATAKAALSRERRRRDSILSAVPVGIVGHDVDGEVMFRNERATEILSAPAAELDGDAYEDAGWTLLSTDGTRIPAAELPYRRAMAGERFDAVYDLRLADGSVHRIAVHAAPLDADDGVDGAVVAFHGTDEDATAG